MKKFLICFVVAAIALLSFLAVRDYKYDDWYPTSTETVEIPVVDTLTVDSLSVKEVVDSPDCVKPSDC